jgi:hypothetical protein
MKRILVVCTLLFLCLAAFAQDKPAAKTKKEAKPTAAAPSGMPPMPKPGPEMKKLISQLGGNFTSTMKSEPMPQFNMPASTSTGPARLYAGPGGLSLIETVNATDEHGMKFSGHGIFYWDPKAKAYKGIWCDNGTPSGCMEGGTGNWQGDKLVFTGPMDMMGKTYNVKSTYSDFTADGYLFTMETGEGSGPMQKMFTVEYKKSAPKAATPGK